MEADRSMGLQMDGWLIRFVRRIARLPSGRYLVTLTIGKRIDWTIVKLGQPEE
jgi:hypothetical protein